MEEIINGLLIVLVPMMLGYLAKIQNQNALAFINKIVMLLLYIILFMMGFMLGQLENLEQKLPIIGMTALGLSAIILTCNILGLAIYDRTLPKPVNYLQGELPSRWHSLVDSIKLLSAVIIGIVLGWLCNDWLHFPHGSNLYVLIALIFFVGIQLRNNGISLKEVLLNKQGLMMGAIFYPKFFSRWCYFSIFSKYADYSRFSLFIGIWLVFFIKRRADKCLGADAG